MGASSHAVRRFQGVSPWGLDAIALVFIEHENRISARRPAYICLRTLWALREVATDVICLDCVANAAHDLHSSVCGLCFQASSTGWLVKVDGARLPFGSVGSFCACERFPKSLHLGFEVGR